ncbi:MAG: CcoQ/FixQ family Cbb3-type cytochrome c oxidase assembly chaperone [Chitinophagales bacterium]
MNFMHYLSDIDGVSIYPIFSLLVFFIFFIVLFYFVMRMDKNSIDEMKNIPLENEPSENNSSTTKMP